MISMRPLFRPPFNLLFLSRTLALRYAIILERRMAGERGDRAPGSALNPNALAPADAARLLTKAGGEPVTEEMFRAGLDDGAPLNRDGTVNLVHYAAWLVKEGTDRY